MTDDCTDEPDTCECPECRAWRVNKEPRALTFDDALGNVTGLQERLDEAMRLK